MRSRYKRLPKHYKIQTLILFVCLTIYQDIIGAWHFFKQIKMILIFSEKNKMILIFNEKN